jgi:hypothetical protein
MPVEIRELHIRVAVNPGPASQGQASAAESADHGSGSDKDAIVAECVEQVMQIIQSKKER